jgi:iron complex transport system ATP-binding protein
LNLASRFSDRIVLLSGGRVTASGRPDQVLTEDRLRETFGCRVEVHDLAELGRLVVPLAPETAR